MRSPIQQRGQMSRPKPPPRPTTRPPATQRRVSPQSPLRAKEHFNAFVNDLKRCAKARQKKFSRRFKKSSMEGLLQYLEKNMNPPQPFAGAHIAQKVENAKNHCKDKRDSRIEKYKPALNALAKVWGTYQPYREEPVQRVAAKSDSAIVKSVCTNLAKVKIADVDFSANVKKYAKKKMIKGRSLYDIVKKEWEGPANRRQGGGTALTPYLEHEQAIQTAKIGAKGGLMSLSQLKVVAKKVKQYGYAVCESIAATVIHDCKSLGFKERMEMIGIKYGGSGGTTGHVVVVVNRNASSSLNNEKTWGDYYVIDMWYYNLGMRDTYLHKSKSDFYRKDMLGKTLVPLADIKTLAG